MFCDSQPCLGVIRNQVVLLRESVDYIRGVASRFAGEGEIEWKGKVLKVTWKLEFLTPELIFLPHVETSYEDGTRCVEHGWISRRIERYMENSDELFTQSDLEGVVPRLLADYETCVAFNPKAFEAALEQWKKGVRI